MALLVLIVLGALLGWIASILARTEAAGSILRQMAVGIVIALAGGLFFNTGSPLGGLSLIALGVAAAGAVAALIIYHFVLGQRDNLEA